jgi:hypothetical protein
VTEERGNKCGKVRDDKCKRRIWWENLGGGGGHGAKAETWPGQ